MSYGLNYVIPQNMLIPVLDISVDMKKYLDKNQLKEGRYVLAHNSMLQSIIAESQGSKPLKQLVT